VRAIGIRKARAKKKGEREGKNERKRKRGWGIDCMNRSGQEWRRVKYAVWRSNINGNGGGCLPVFFSCSPFRYADNAFFSFQTPNKNRILGVTTKLEAREI
jgi:hypothetical protein